ncbi:hypothetical protein SO802_008523 [Lithocarpus litseifolius]|uniref:RNase H type-1 domain-containing protein n=1 Tax=Lithocarpus litseifolius TaxID=425828 RepID=A0AAW2DD22_9ROSI
MEATKSSRGSYAWKSILQGRDVIKRGACWRIGNGQKVKIWQHSWLPIKHTTRVSSPILLEGWEEATVEILINEDTQTWNEDAIDGLFVPEEAALIKKIQLSRHLTEDKLFWPWTQSGKYSFKSAYRFLKYEVDEIGAEAMQVEDRNLSHNIWDSRVPNKIKNFMWRACHDSIPTKANLRLRHITDNPLCERSGIGVVIRDHTGSIIASLAQLIAPAFQPTEIEAIAAFQALEFGQEIGISGAVLEGDSKLIIDSLKVVTQWLQGIHLFRMPLFFLISLQKRRQ